MEIKCTAPPTGRIFFISSRSCIFTIPPLRVFKYRASRDATITNPIIFCRLYRLTLLPDCVKCCIMNTHAAIHIAKLCGAVDPTVSGQTVYEAAVLGMSFELRLIYIANDDLTFVNRCTHQWDEYSAGMHREPYY